MSFITPNLFAIEKITSLLCMLLLMMCSTLHALETVRVGVLLDGPIKREYVPLDQIFSEIRDLNKNEFNVEFPADQIRHGSWQVALIKNELLSLLNDPNIDVIITNGILGSQQAALIKNLNKPVIAAIVADRVLLAQFNSVRRPIIIFATIPLGIIGVTFGLLVANSSIGFFTILGIISLAGIIINNAIVLIDRIKIEIEELGKQQAVAVIDACLQRVRPILLTTATTVLGMMPLWCGGTAMFRPMAVTIIFGLLFATFLTLLLVPVLYSTLFRVSYKTYN